VFWWGSFKEGDRLEDLGLKGRRQCTHNVTFRHVRATIVVVENQ